MHQETLLIFFYLTLFWLEFPVCKVETVVHLLGELSLRFPAFSLNSVERDILLTFCPRIVFSSAASVYPVTTHLHPLPLLLLASTHLRTFSSLLQSSASALSDSPDCFPSSPASPVSYCLHLLPSFTAFFGSLFPFKSTTSPNSCPLSSLSSWWFPLLLQPVPCSSSFAAS